MTVTRLSIALIPAIAVALANYVVAGMLPGDPTCASCLAWLVGAPIALALLELALLSRLPQTEAEQLTPAPPAVPEVAPALRLLGMLQEEGRFVDFVQEELGPYPDDQIGAAVRSIHEGCRKALGEHIGFEPVMKAAEGETVTVEPGFDPASIRLVGNVTGTPPFTGVLRHPGWRATRAVLPARAGHDPHVIAPAEVELS